MAMFDKHKSGKQDTPSSPETRAAHQAPSMDSTPASTAAKVAMIGPGIGISGDVNANSNLKVEGQIEGRSVKSSHDIEISEMGKVTASVMAKVVKVAGEVTGDISGSEKVLITRTGRVQGNIVAPRVQLEDGAIFRGSIDMNPADPAAAKPAAEKKTEKKTTAEAASSRTAATGTAGKDPGLTLKSG